MIGQARDKLRINKKLADSFTQLVLLTQASRDGINEGDILRLVFQAFLPASEDTSLGFKPRITGFFAPVPKQVDPKVLYEKIKNENLQERIDSNVFWALHAFLKDPNFYEQEFQAILQAYQLEFTRKCARLLIKFTKKNWKDDTMDGKSSEGTV